MKKILMYAAVGVGILSCVTAVILFVMRGEALIAALERQIENVKAGGKKATSFVSRLRGVEPPQNEAEITL